MSSILRETTCRMPAALQAQQLQDSSNAKALGHTTGLRILFRSKLFKRLTVCCFITMGQRSAARRGLPQFVIDSWVFLHASLTRQ
jgi:hypothetical protein